MMKLSIPLLFVAVTMVSAMPRGGPPGGMDMNNPAKTNDMMKDPRIRKIIMDAIFAKLQQADPRMLQNFFGKLTGGNVMGGFQNLFNKPSRPEPYRPPPQPYRPPFMAPPQQQPPPNYGMPPGGNVYQRNQKLREIEKVLYQRALNKKAQLQRQRYLASWRTNPHSSVQRFKQLLLSRRQTTGLPRPRPSHHQNMHHHRPMPRPQPNNNGLLMDVQGGYGGPAAGGMPGAAPVNAMMMYGGEYCPPGNLALTTGKDKCKDMIIHDALYNKTTGQPLYPSWVPPRNPMDPLSIPDHVKDYAMNILIQKVQSSPTRKATLKQKNLMRALGDPPNAVKPMFGIFI